MEKTKRVRISNESLNSYGTRVLTSGMDVDQYKRNPVLLYMHERGQVIGYVKDLRVEGDDVTDITLMPTKLGFQTGDEKMEGLPYFATGEEGEKIFGKYRELSANLGTELVYEKGYIKVLQIDTE